MQYTGPIPLLSAILPASSSLACRRTAAPCQPGRNGSMKSNTTAFRDGDRVRVSSQRGNDYTDRVPLIASGCTFGDADHEMVKQRYEPGPR